MEFISHLALVKGYYMSLITLNYGSEGIQVDIPEHWDVTCIEKKTMPVCHDPADSVLKAFSDPVGSDTLQNAAHGSHDACILICDITRPVPNGIILPALIRELLKAGIAAENITVLVATGLHRPNEGKELEELVGDRWVLDKVRVENHFAQNDEDHVNLGKSRCGIPIRLDRRFVDADLKIVTGLVEPHFMAGYSGGRKVITPGIAHRETIGRFHTARFLEHTQAANCVLEGNPLHEFQLEILGKLSPVLAINTVIDDKRRLSYVNFGDIRQSHLAAVDYLGKYSVIPVEEKFPIVLTSAGGYPLDKTYYQTVKGMVGAMDILKPGGDLIIVSECSEGMGSAAYIDAQRRLVSLGAKGFMESLGQKITADVDEWQTEMQLKPMRIGFIHLFSRGLSDKDRTLTGVAGVDNLKETIRICMGKMENKKIAVIPEGPYVMPVYNCK